MSFKGSYNTGFGGQLLLGGCRSIARVQAAGATKGLGFRGLGVAFRV